MSGRTSEDILWEPPPPDADARVVYGPEPLQFGDLRLPLGPGAHPLVVTIHGGYWKATYNLTHLGHVCADLGRRGIATWNLEYRRIGDPGGGWPTVLDDVQLALSHVPALARTVPLDLDRVVVLGHSAGGQLALLAARTTTLALRGVVALAGVVDLQATHEQGDDAGIISRLLGGGPTAVPDLWREASPAAQRPLGVRAVLVCGTDDPHWDSNLAMTKAAAADGDDVDLVELRGVGHFEPIDPTTPAWETVRTTIVGLLDAPTA
jgi:acetyl esterase/lipase